jgi:hypothetical protein
MAFVGDMQRFKGIHQAQPFGRNLAGHSLAHPKRTAQMWCVTQLLVVACFPRADSCAWEKMRLQGIMASSYIITDDNVQQAQSLRWQSLPTFLMNDARPTCSRGGRAASHPALVAPQMNLD